MTYCAIIPYRVPEKAPCRVAIGCERGRCRKIWLNWKWRESGQIKCGSISEPEQDKPRQEILFLEKVKTLVETSILW